MQRYCSLSVLSVQAIARERKITSLRTCYKKHHYVACGREALVYDRLSYQDTTTVLLYDIYIL